MAALAKFLSRIWVGVGIGKFFNDLGVRNIFYAKITQSVSMLTSGWLTVSLRYISD
jgi:hypothetical protein